MKIKDYDLLLFFAVFLLVVSLINFAFVLKDVVDYRKITGYNIETGKANLTVESEANIAFFVNFTDWGSGAVNASEGDYAVLNTEDLVESGTWSANNQPLVLYNIGNSNVSIDLRADKTASEFIGGVGSGGPEYQIKVENNDSGACFGGVTNFVSYANILTTDTRACNNLQFLSDRDSLNIDIRVRIPSDSDSGTKSSIITATGTVV